MAKTWIGAVLLAIGLSAQVFWLACLTLVGAMILLASDQKEDSK